MKHTMKLVAILVAIIAISALCLTACGEKADFTVGILQPVAHDALGAANRGFQEELTRLMTEAGKTVKFEDQNAQGNASTQVTIVNGFVAKGVDLMLTIGTDATKTAQGIGKCVRNAIILLKNYRMCMSTRTMLHSTGRCA